MGKIGNILAKLKTIARAPAGGNGGRRADDSVGASDPGFGIGYDAIRHKGRRAMPGGRVLSEDQELRQLPRRNLTTNIRDLNRNFAICSWMIRRHLDYVSTFHFRSKNGNPELDAQVEAFMRWWAKPQNCDPAGRHSLPRLVRMWEMRRVIDGDVLINRQADGRVGTIEGDRIQSFGGVPFQELGIEDASKVVNGVWLNDNGRAKGYMVFKRQPLWTGLLWDRMVPARFADLLGYFDRYDQCRGISPLAAAANTLRDCYEGFEFALVKAKIAQYFAMIVTRQASDDFGKTEEKEGETEPASDPDKPRYDANFGKGPVFLDMDPGDEAKILESNQPSEQFQGFSQIMIMVSLKALDIPYSFFDESHTNYSGARLAGVQFYEAAVKIKQADLRLILDKITKWRLGLAIADGHIVLPDGVSPRSLEWEWEHAGIPLYDPLKEISASIASINAGLSSHEREAKKLGLDFYQLIDERARAEQYAKEKGVILSTALPAVAMDDPNNSKTQTEDENQESDRPEGTKSRKIQWP